jgi:formylglycine-generating enzyme required for sulfatase activity
VFPATEQQWHHDTLAKLVGDLERFVSSPDPAVSLVAAMRRRLAFAEAVEKRTLIDPAEAWRRTIEAIADAAASASYRGLRIRPQLGLVPIGRDPSSGFYEFVHVESGVAPVRDATGRLAIDDETGIVLVLLPGGTFEMGAAPPGVAPGSPNVDPHARSDELPPHQVTLGPFFMSKYEMTQGQWLRVTGTNPSSPGQSLSHPLNHSTFEECTRTLMRIGLEIPTEAQWEYAARGGTHTPWWTGAETRSMGGAGNVADRSVVAGAPPSWHYEDWLDDGHAGPAPVGLYRPNPFGMHDVIGNVWEWCRDPCQDYAVKPEGDAALRNVAGADSGTRMARGGSYIYSALDARSSRRSPGLPKGRSIYSGLRPARPIRDG